MSFPLIRPEDVEHMPRRQIDRLLARLEEECHAAGVRHREILRARLIQRDPSWATSARLTELGRCADLASSPEVVPLPAPTRGALGRFERPARRAS